MRDNGRRELFGLANGVGLVKVVSWTRTENQLARHEGFAPEAIHVRDDESMTSSEAPATMRLAEPPKWTHRDDLPCTKLVPVAHARDPYDTNDRAKAKALCTGCPVRLACLDDAMEEEAGLTGRSRYLVRGGYTPRERGEGTDLPSLATDLQNLGKSIPEGP